MSDCSNGCPCPDYECSSIVTTTSSTTTISPNAKSSVLVLSTRIRSGDVYMNRPLLTNVDGLNDANFHFMFGVGTSVEESCHLVWKNKLYIFGGDRGGNQTRQVSRLDSCTLTNIGSLNFNFDEGACANFHDRRVYLCFDREEQKLCRFAESPEGTFAETSFSHEIHAYTKIASSQSEVINISTYLSKF